MVSVIIPIYNTQDYLEECIKSVVNQKYSQLEIILINDGSTDMSGEICRKWAALDSRIRYVEKENEGQGIARNLGIQMAKGKYIVFIDSDDYMEYDLISGAYDRITKTGADICVYAHNGIGDKIYKGTLEFKLLKESNVKENKELLGRLLPILWDKMYSAALIKAAGITMSNRICEDLVFNARLYMKARGICFLERPLYNYRYLRQGNVSTNYGRYFEVEESIREVNEIFRQEGYFKDYWMQLYKISFNMFKDILFRVGVREDYAVPPEIKSRYPELFCAYKNFLGRWYSGYLTMEVQEKNFLLAGSYSLRVIIHHLLLNEEFLREDYAGSSIISLMSNPVDRVEDSFLHSMKYKNSYRKRCVEQDIKKVFQHKAGLEGVDYVAVDLLDEIYDLISFGEGCYITESAFLIESTSAKKEQYVRIPFVSPKRRELFQKYASLFAEKICQAHIPVIVVKNFLCEKHGEYYDSFTAYDSLEWIRQVNRELEWCYDYLLQCLPKAIVAEASKFRQLEFTHDNFPFGLEPVYYNSSYYQNMAISINQGIRAFSEAVILEKLQWDLEEYDKIFLIREDELQKERLLGAFLNSKAAQETKRKVLVLSTAAEEESRNGRLEYRQITAEHARYLLSLYHMYEFSNQFRLISSQELCGDLFGFVENGLLDMEEMWEALLHEGGTDHG